jgi:hypothetical protein
MIECLVEVVAAPHSPQNFCDEGLLAPHVEQVIVPLGAARFAGPSTVARALARAAAISSALA